MEANQRTFRTKRITNLPVEVRVDGIWLPGLARDYVGRARRKVVIDLEDGTSVTSHLGKVVLREDDSAEHGSGGEDGEEGGKKTRQAESQPQQAARIWRERLVEVEGQGR